MAFIGLGKFNLHYSFIFILVFFKFVSDYLEGFNEKNYYNRVQEEKFVDFGSIFAYHPLFRDFMFFFGSALCGIILYYFYRKNEKLKNGLMSLEKISTIRSQLLGDKNISYYLDLSIISFIFALNISLRTFLMSMKFDAGFWTLEILFVIYLSIKILKVKFGNHQKVTVFILAFILFSLQIIISFLPGTDHDCKDEKCFDKNLNDNNLYIFMTKKFGHFGYIFLILFLYILNFIMRDFSWVRLKFLMDIKSIPLFKILLFMGIIGCAVIIIGFIIASNVPCEIMENIKMINGFYFDMTKNEEVDFMRHVCGLINYDEQNNKLTFYYDHFVIFFKDITNSTRKAVEISIIPIYFIINIMIHFSYAMILKHLDPNAMLVNVNFNYLISRMLTYIKNKGRKEYLTVAKFTLLELCEILAIIAYMIYIELIELKFCKLDYHIKKQIQERGIKDAIINLNEFDDFEEYNVDLNKKNDEDTNNSQKNNDPKDINEMKNGEDINKNNSNNIIELVDKFD